MAFRFPNPDEHSAVVGRNGSGKTRMGAWLFSKRDLANTRNVIVDYKGEELFSSLERIHEISLNELPKENGLYIVRSRPDLVDETERWLWKVWEQENTGLFIDEGYMLPDEGAFRALLTQGRSKRIPVMTLSQRPVEISRFVFSEASHVVLFHLNDERDEKTVKAFTPKGFIDWVPNEFLPADRLPKFHSKWYNIKDDEVFALKPVPSDEQIIAEIDGQLKPKQRWL